MTKEIFNTSLVVLGFIAILVLIIQLVNYRNVKKQKEHFENLHKDLKVGSKVILTDGIYGQVTKLSDDYVMLRVAKDVEIKVSRFSIQEIVK